METISNCWNNQSCITPGWTDMASVSVTLKLSISISTERSQFDSGMYVEWMSEQDNPYTRTCD